ncbi:MAG: DUF2294 domain-containing protein [Phycisphaerae bacterium]
MRSRATAVPSFNGFALTLSLSSSLKTCFVKGNILEMNMKTQGEIEAAICEGITWFQQEYMGRGPQDIHAYLIADLLVVRMQGVLTVTEQHLVQSLPCEKGRDLLKQIRIQLMETARPVLEAMVKEVTGVKVLSLHHDISTVSGEKVVIFTLAESPLFRKTKEKVESRLGLYAMVG